MFRKNELHKISKSNFGVGSTVIGSSTEKWLVIAGQLNTVSLVNMANFTLVGMTTKVVDQNWMTSDEARDLVNTIDNNYTFSDFKLCPEGLK